MVLDRTPFLCRVRWPGRRPGLSARAALGCSFSFFRWHPEQADKIHGRLPALLRNADVQPEQTLVEVNM